MTVRTVSGPTISEALAEARRAWGASVVLLEARPPTDGAAAQISVCYDSEPVGAGRSLDLMVEDRGPQSSDPAWPAAGSIRRPARGSGRLFTRPDVHSPAVTPAREEQPLLPRKQVSYPSIDTVLKHVNRDGSALPVAPERSLAHADLFGALVRAGVRPGRARRVSDATNPADELSRDLPPAYSSAPPKSMVFVGAPGAGKTSFVIRTAKSRIRAGLPAPVIAVLRPAYSAFWQDPTPLYEKHGLSAALVSTAEIDDLARRHSSEGLLVDTASPTWDSRSMHVRLVVDARASHTSLCGRVDSVVVSHLGSTDTAGYVAESLISIGVPVAGLVRNPASAAEAYRPLTFATAVCHA